ncbi:MAG: RidA family protein [Erysipelotrichaceae bacterium]|nr:RidA family protein [Erysipelotrichaceae bacterium]
MSQKAITPFSPYIVNGNTVYVSGQLPVDKNGNIPESVGEQTKVCLQNLKEQLRKAGFQPNEIVKVTVMITDFSRFGEMNEAYLQELEEPYPARSAFECTRLAKDAKVEIDCIASHR